MALENGPLNLKAPIVNDKKKQEKERRSVRFASRKRLIKSTADCAAVH
jgi:hypothetical protein